MSPVLQVNYLVPFGYLPFLLGNIWLAVLGGKLAVTEKYQARQGTDFMPNARSVRFHISPHIPDMSFSPR